LSCGCCCGDGGPSCCPLGFPAPSADSITAGFQSDPVSKRVVLFAGFDAAGYLDDTWTFDGTTWTREAPPLSPSARAAASIAYDAVAHRLVLFGGYDGTSYLAFSADSVRILGRDRRA